MPDRYGRDVLAPRPRPGRPTPPAVTLRPGLRLTHRASRFTGVVVETDGGRLTLRAPDGRERVFRAAPDAFAADGRPVRLARPARPPAGPRLSASLASVDAGQPARIARASRIWVEGNHDAELLEKVWGDELRDLGLVVEPLGGIDGLPAAVTAFGPGPDRQLGVLVDHLVPGSKESRIAAAAAHPHVLITGHPYVDVWAGVRPGVLGIAAWPDVPPGTPWKEGVAAALGVADPREVWRRALRGVRSIADLEVGLVGAVERLLDFLVPPM